MLRRWLLLSVAMWLAAFIVPGFRVHGLWNTVVVAALFGILNTLVGWFITAVLFVGTLGLPWLLGLRFLVLWVSNTVVLELTASLSSRVHIGSFGSALAASAFISLIGVVLESALGNDESARSR
jgi:putative membrane protein